MPTASTSWAWNDTIGWIDFYNQGNSNVIVSTTTLVGSNVSSSVGIISLDCASAPWGCGVSYGVTNNGGGSLGGYAWNDTVGWISFYWGNSAASSTQAKSPLCVSYGIYCGVSIDAAGAFHGYAWNDTIGWISFNDEVFGGNSYWTATSWNPVAAVGMLDSTTIDTGVASGTELNSVMWHGSLNLPSGPPYPVGFQFAVSNSSSGPWTFIGPAGTTSTSDVYAGTGYPDTPIQIYNYSEYVGYRYFRYRAILLTNSVQSISPQVTGVSVDWSP